MRAFPSLLYGVCAYMASQLALLYLVGFSGNLFVSRSVDVGPGAPWPQAVATDLLLLALFGIQHSVMARQGFKRWWTRVVPPALERSTFGLATSVVLALMFVFWVPITEPVVWRVEQGVGVALLWSLYGLGWSLALVSTFLIDHYELFGLRQVLARLKHRDPPEARFRTPGLYRCVRHPLYAGLMLTFWSVPVMTAGRLLFALGFSAYILIGIAFEERDLLRQFGERYREYRERVGMLVPRPGSPVRTADEE
ncbi:MAG: isoprenylcysteine carboxylmethyltransferase family protein [Burkholderiaceae bacterium]